LGLILAAVSITLVGQLDPAVIGSASVLPAFLPVLIPIFVIAIPLADLLLAILRRTRAGRSPFTPDKKHLHHLLLERGHSQGGAALLMYGIAALFAFPAVAIAFFPIWIPLMAFLIGAVVLVVVLERRPRSKKFVPVQDLI
jgi:UDP-GlcNAc:undecaprenyl-phosphate GlcNAc-1-phosphate transferase